MADPLKPPVSVQIHGLSPSGDGVGRLPDGRAAFVPWTMPGDRATVRVTRERSRWARGELVGLEEPASTRVSPPCPHFGVCGGCAFQHVPYETQLTWKGRFVEDAFRRLGGVDLAEPVSVEPSPLAYEYRNRVTFTVAHRGGRIHAGLRQASRPGRVVDVESCLLAHPAVSDVWPRLREALVRSRALKPGKVARVTVRRVTDGVVLVWAPECPGGDPGVFSAIEGVVEVWEDGRRGPRRLHGDRETTETWFGEEIEVPGPAFTQVNDAAGHHLLQAVVEAVVAGVGDPEGKQVVDAYAGISVTGRRIAALGGHVVAIEREHWAVEAARRNAAGAFEAREGPVEALLDGALPADLVILNPPRSGVTEDVTKCLAEKGPATILYVSCDPATLARDVARLADAYSVGSVRAFDLFPQTPHVEVLVALKRSGPDIVE